MHPVQPNSGISTGEPAPIKTTSPSGADFSILRYAQSWEDADILLAALDPQPDQTSLSIASAGDNSLALLSRGPARVIAVDTSSAQIACLELRVAAYRELEHDELLELIGSRPSSRRLALYDKCRRRLSATARGYWDVHRYRIEQGAGGAGKFEHYFALFRTVILPLVHSRRRVEQLLAGGSASAREGFYAHEWDTWRWRLLFKAFFSRPVMGRLGRDPAFFRYVEGSVAERILHRTRYALTALDPAVNPYLQWVLTGRHTTALPFSLRPENFDCIRRNLDRLQWVCCDLEELLNRSPREISDECAMGRRLGNISPGEFDLKFDRFNLSDIFEYMSLEQYERLLGRLVAASRPGARLAYWNMLAARSRPASLAHRLRPLNEIAQRLFAQDKAWFYSAFNLEEVVS